MYASLTLRRALCLFFFFVGVTLSAARRKNRVTEQTILFFAIFLFSYCENLPPPLAEHFHRVVWRVMPAVFSPPTSPPPHEMPVAPWLSPEDGLLQRNCLPCPLHISHTHHLSIIGLICWGSSAHTHTHTHIGSESSDRVVSERSVSRI